MTAPTAKVEKPLHEANELDARSFKLHFRVMREALYDERRAAFFERWHGLTMMIALLGCMSPMVVFLREWPAWMGALGGYIAVMSLVASAIAELSTKGIEHRARARALRRLGKKLMPMHNFNDEEHAALYDEYHTLLEDVPPTKELLAMECHDMALLYYGHKAPAPRYSWWPRLTKQWFSWDDLVRRDLSASR